MRIVVLGSGTSIGVPVIGCDCPVCRSNDPRNHRLRSSVLVEINEVHLLIDTSPDFRLQCLQNKVRRVDAVLYTHEHADHIFGCDDLRAFNIFQGAEIPAYGHERTIARLQNVFDYFTHPTQLGGGVPRVTFHAVREPFHFREILIEPIPVWHGEMEVFGYRIGPFAYVNDCSAIPEASLNRLRGLKTLILDGLRHRPHSTHFSLGEAVEIAQQLGVERAFFTHMTHDVDHEETSRELPPGMGLTYDGMRIEAPS